MEGSDRGLCGGLGRVGDVRVCVCVGGIVVDVRRVLFVEVDSDGSGWFS
jgi:hypothetical protein